MKIASEKAQEFGLDIIESHQPGPSVWISGIVHGNERCGLSTIRLLYQKFHNKLARGRLFLCAANMLASQSNKRFIDFDLNRCFDNPVAYGHEARVAKAIKNQLSSAEFLLDLHSTSSPTKPFCAGAFTKQHLQLFEMTGIDTYTWGWGTHRSRSMLIDEVDRLGGIGIIAECGQHDDDETRVTAFSTACNFLKGLEMISADKMSSKGCKREIVEIQSIVKAKTDDFAFTKTYENFEKVNAMHVVAYDGGTPIFYHSDFLIALPTATDLHMGSEAFGIGVVKE